jgi:hypothetical protein
LKIVPSRCVARYLCMVSFLCQSWEREKAHASGRRSICGDANTLPPQLKKCIR